MTLRDVINLILDFDFLGFISGIILLIMEYWKEILIVVAVVVSMSAIATYYDTWKEKRQQRRGR